MKFTKQFILLLLLIALKQYSVAELVPKIEDYGERAAIRSMTMSPSGRTVAFIAELDQFDGQDLLFTYSDDDGIRPIFDVGALNGNSVTFIDEENVVVRGYTELRYGRLYHQVLAINLTDKTHVALLENKNDRIVPVHAGLRDVVGQIEESGELMLPAWGTNGGRAERRLYRVNMATGHGYMLDRGSQYTLKWLVSRDGEVLAREEMRTRQDKYIIHTIQNGDFRKLYEQDTSTPPFSVVGMLPDESALVLKSLRFDTPPFYLLDFNGNLGVFDVVDTNDGVTTTLTDLNGKLFGFRHASLSYQYTFLDRKIQDTVDHILATQPGLTFEILQVANDGSRLLAKIFSSKINERYVLVDVLTKKISVIAPSRESITDSQVAPVYGIEYLARDGRIIPAVLTVPTGETLETTELRSTIILPHGGPRSHDLIEFDWLAQYFAGQGYVVLQPNFRGSTGFGEEHTLAGNGEWGAAMQDDLTDGLNFLIGEGLTDKNRVCIIGWSYGGYAALMGGATTPGLFKCIVAIAPVTNLRRFFTDTKSKYGYSTFIVDYWAEMIGDPKQNRDMLNSRSPVFLADNFTAPTLIIHGEKDRIVKIRHSKQMDRALKRAGKSVKFVEIEGEGHSMLESENRLLMLKEISIFVDAHLGHDMKQSAPSNSQ